MTAEQLPAQLRQKLGAVLYFQVFHIVGAATWNVVGVILLSMGLRSPGPTASLLMAVILLIVGAAIIFGAYRYKWLYILAGCLAGIGGFLAIYQAFNLDPALWPSEFWRYAGVALNSVGFLSAITGVWKALK